MSVISARRTETSLSSLFRKWANTPITVSVLLEWELYLVAASFFLHSFGVPTTLCDIACFFNLALLVFSMKRIGGVFNRHPGVFCVGMILLAYSIGTAIYNGVSPLSAFWQFVVFSRPFVYGFLALAYWDADRFDAVFRRFVGLQWLNVILAALEFILLGLDQDLVGGMFGSYLGCNLPLNVYLCVVTAAMISAYLNKHWNVNAQVLLASCLSSLCVAAVAELKFFYLEFILILLCAFLFCRPTLKKFALVFFALVVLVVGFSLFASVFPVRAANMLNFDTLYEEANLRGAGYPISRVEVYKDLGRILFASNPLQQVIGLGLGATANSSISIFTSPLADLYASYKFGLLQSILLCVDIGYIGTGLYIAFLVSFGVVAWANKSESHFLSLFSIFVIVVFVVNIYYNSTASSANSTFWALPLICTLSFPNKNSKGRDIHRDGNSRFYSNRLSDALYE